MKEYFKINNIDVGFKSPPNENTKISTNSEGFLDNEVSVRKGRLRINLLTPPLEITDDMHNGMLSSSYYNKKRNIDYFRIATYSSPDGDFVIDKGNYGVKIEYPKKHNELLDFGCYGFPEEVEFHGTIDIQKGYVHVEGILKNRLQEYYRSLEGIKEHEEYLKSIPKRYKKPLPHIPIEILKQFDPKPLIPSREEHTWEEAQKANPLNVYNLTIEGENLELKEFPVKILEFKNLESFIVKGWTGIEFTEFPEAFYSLKELHTIKLFQYPQQTSFYLSEQIKKLTKLEELSITNTGLTSLPNALFDLPSLTNLCLSNNNLTYLPKELGTMQNLRELDITQNNFKTLPKEILNIYDLKIEKKHLKLIEDISYNSKNENPIDESLYNLSNYPEKQTQLEKSILAIPKIVEFQNMIMYYSSIKTSLILDKDKKDIPIGTSKVGGSPDLPKDCKHPKDKNGLLYIFHAQINCEEIAEFQNYLPRKGMLYFFVDDEEYAENPMVLYSETNEALTRFKYTKKTEFTDSNFNGDFRKEVKVHFENSISLPEFYNSSYYGKERYPKYKSLWENPENQKKVETLENCIGDLEKVIEESLDLHNDPLQLRTHSLNSSVFTQHESPQEQAAGKLGGESNEWLVLLNMESIDEFNFWDAGTLSYCIHKKDLAIKDFSNVYTSIESS